VIKDGDRVRFYSRHGAEYADRLPRMVEAFGKLLTRSAILDGELVLIDPTGAAHFWRLMVEMRTRAPDESQLMFLVFDILHPDGVDLRGLSLTERKRDLDRLCRGARIKLMRQVETFPDGQALLEYATILGSKASCRSDGHRDMPADRADTGSRSSVQIGSAPTPSGGRRWKRSPSQASARRSCRRSARTLPA